MDRDGLLLVDKPSGPTSHDIVARARRALGMRRIGHTGTLDPLATGLLPLVCGRATRLARFLPASPKTYTGALALGWTTDTDDVTGETTSRHEGDLPPAHAVHAASAELVGRYDQTPPAYSARKVGGERLYRLARRGQVVEVPPRRVEVSRLGLFPADSPGRYRFEVEVSAGTYVRAIVRDLGRALGCGAVLVELRRTAIGPMDVADAVPLDAGDRSDDGRLVAAVIALSAMPLTPPTVCLDQDQARRFAHGRTVRPGAPGGPAGPYRVIDATETLLGIGESQDGTLEPRVVLVLPESP